MKRITNEQLNICLDALEEMHPEAKCALDYDSIFHLLIAVCLSAQTTDVSVNKVTPALFAKFVLPSDLAVAEVDDVESMIRSIGLYKNKAKNIIAMSQMLVDEFNGEVPRTREELVKLPGVGRKTANVVMSEAYGEPAIAVDTHVFRVSNRIGITDAKDVAHTEEQLMKRITKDKWIRMHHLLIFHGRKICASRNPKCNECKISDLCIFNRIKH